MIRKIAIFFSVVLALPLSSQAMVGGPFDSNDYGQSLDDQGVYQANFRMKNGTGFAQFGTNVDLVFNSNLTSSSGTGNTAIATNIGGVLNRSLVYLRGISYIGIASGSVDHDAGTVTGITNGLSDGTASSGSGASASSAVVVSNGGRNFSANSSFRAKITRKAPYIKFSGTGEITVLASVSATAEATINSAVQAAAPQQSATAAATSSTTDNSAAIAANQAALLQSTLNYINAVLPYIVPDVNGSIIPNQSFSEKMWVKGSRVFFVSRR